MVKIIDNPKRTSLLTFMFYGFYTHISALFCIKLDEVPWCDSLALDRTKLSFRLISAALHHNSGVQSPSPSSLQVYAPISGQDRSFHRTLFLFCCRTHECYMCNDSRCMKGNRHCCFDVLMSSSPLLMFKHFSSASGTFSFFTRVNLFLTDCVFSSLPFSFQKSATEEKWVLPLRPSTRFVYFARMSAPPINYSRCN